MGASINCDPALIHGFRRRYPQISGKMSVDTDTLGNPQQLVPGLLKYRSGHGAMSTSEDSG